VHSNHHIIQTYTHTALITPDVNDFYRTTDSTTPYVDGQLSLDAYLDATTSAWDDLAARRGLPITDVDRFLHHQPFTKMARKQLAALAEHTSTELSDELIEEPMNNNRALGNHYTA